MFGFQKAFSKKKDSGKTWSLEDKFELISREEYIRLRENLRSNEGDYAFLEGEINEDTERRNRLIADIEANKTEITRAINEKEGFEAVRDADARGIQLNPDDRAFLQRADVEAIEQLPITLRERDEKLRQEKATITKRLDQLKKNLQEYVINELGLAYVFEKSGAYYKIGGASTTLSQPSGESLRIVGTDFRELLTDEDSLRALNHALAVAIMKRYAKAAGCNHPDFGHITRILSRQTLKCRE